MIGAFIAVESGIAASPALIPEYFPMTRLNRKAWTQFISIAAPYWKSEEKWTPIGLSLLLIGLLVAYTQSSVLVNDRLGELTSALAAADSERFWSGIRIFLYLLIVAIPINAFYYYVRDKLSILWRRWLTKRFLGDYFGNRAYYDLLSNATIDNPDQRIADDINTFTQRSLYFFLIVANGVMQLVAFSAVLWSISRILVAFLVIYAAMGTFVTIFAFGRGLTILNYLQLKKEADFRFSLVRVRENAESIAFYQGEDKERILVEHRFTQAFLNYSKLIWWQLYLSMFQYAYSNGSYLVPYVVLAPSILAGDMEVGVVMKAYGAFSACLISLNLVIDNFDSLSKFAAGIDRLDSFRKAIAERRESEETIETRTGNAISLDRVTLKVPRRDRVLIRDVSLAIKTGEHVVISGPSGCGKTSLLRAIIGLWNHGSGTVTRPNLDDLLFLPQRPYMIQGSLREQLLYPRHVSASDDELRQALRDVQLPHLLEGDDDLDSEADWSKMLSVGEQQRLSFARLLLTKPLYAFLDEATSALDPKSEAHMYGLLKQSGTTFVSISHHPAIREFHNVELLLTGGGKWQVQDIEEASDSGPLQSRS
jgi:putative ATP-binding cassette transporter